MSGQTSYLPQKSGEGEEEGEGYRRHGACISVLVYVSQLSGMTYFGCLLEVKNIALPILYPFPNRMMPFTSN